MLLEQARADEDELKAIDAEVKQIVAEAAEFARTSPEPDPSELYTDVYLEACSSDRHPDAGAVSDHGRGHPGQVAREGGRHRQGRRRHRRDRDRQGDHGGRGRRRGRDRGDPGRRRHRGREGQHADRPPGRRGRRRRPGAARPRRAKPNAAGRRRPRQPPRPSRRARRRRRRRRRRRPRSSCAIRRFPAGRQAGQDHRARRPARRHGRGDAPRRERLPDGRGSRPVPGRLQGQPRPAAGVRRPPRDRHPDHRARLRRPGRRRGHGGPEADRRVHDLQLRHAGDRPHHQLGRQDALHVGRPDPALDRVPRPQRRGRPRRRPAQPGLFRLVRPRAGPEGRRAL